MVQVRAAKPVTGRVWSDVMLRSSGADWSRIGPFHVPSPKTVRHSRQQSGEQLRKDSRGSPGTRDSAPRTPDWHRNPCCLRGSLFNRSKSM